MRLTGWTAEGETFVDSIRIDGVVEVRVQVTIYRATKFFPAGKKRAVTWHEPVLRGAVMTLDAWECLAGALSVAGCECATEPRDCR